MDYEGTDLSLLTNHFNSTCAAEPLYTTMEVMKMNTVAKLELPCESLVKSLGSINGVLLFDTGDQLCIWNPSIRMYQKFSPPKYIGGDHRSIYGLGYDSVSDDFKVVSIIRPVKENNQAEADGSFTISDPPYAVHVFSSKLSSWKSIGDIAYTGILLLQMSYEELCLWNPSIRMFRKFSSPKPSGIPYTPEPGGNPMYGLGYDSVSDDFKVVRILLSYSDDVPCPVHVFSSKLGLWKRIGNFSYCISAGNMPGMVLNGSPHWVVDGDMDINRYYIKDEDVLMVLSSEKVLFHLMAALALEGTTNLIKVEEQESSSKLQIGLSHRQEGIPEQGRVKTI
ncbi:hypothetical protein Vadar_006641 [Vaccinium darrowii]|uniref:Uncharacterized protein n=1 Tax=Vaccinium darrowii TaxID=229202 RepID=A0ACB7XQ20_9ERIC|nr:hypothetical protein Vadar_006641 [Vaccinium darrowii]